MRKTIPFRRGAAARGAGLLPLLLGALCACQGTGGGSPGLTSDGFPAPSKAAVYDVAVEAVREQGFTLDPDLSAEDAGRIETRWKISLQPFAGKGRRDKLTLRIEDVPGRAGYYRVDTRVERQVNENIEQPDVLAAAEWKDPVPVPDLEQLINRRVEFYFLGPQASAEFRTRYGMDPESGGRVPTPPKPANDTFLGLPLR